jgi:AmmeMemoRadiSam system protein A
VSLAMGHTTLFEQTERSIILQTARDSIAQGITQHHPLTLDLSKYPSILLEPGASFVTIHMGTHLRGCIGSLQAYQPLITDVAQNAFNAAFRDPRFLPMTESELSKISLDISVLSKPQPMRFTSEADLLSQLQPGIDGLIISDNGHRGTFLPSVWEQLPDPATFLNHLKAKAGLPTNYWSNSLTIQRYTTELIS